ncbi:hypothetical protein, partial [Oscillibacter sp. CU971]|uniref:hypothetical protein n=1 Tax=Oscillibacter sp. CU971 TaxID=2780102 RepID=UPI001957ABFD
QDRFNGKEGCVRGTQEGFPAPFGSHVFQQAEKRVTEWAEQSSAHSVNNWQIWFYGLFFPGKCGILKAQGHSNLK